MELRAISRKDSHAKVRPLRRKTQLSLRLRANRSLAKKITKAGEPSFTQSYVYLGDEYKILLGKSGNGEITLYLDGQGIDEHLGEVSSRGARAYATDHLGSVLNGEAVGVARAFGAWGENLNATAPEISASSPPVEYGYTRRQLDTESQSYYYRARTYLPEVGRFAQPDPIGFWAGDVNFYRYVGNRPVVYTDPAGLIWPNILGAGLGVLGAYVTGGSATDMFIAGVTGFAFPMAGPFVGAGLGFFGHLLNPEPVGRRSDVPQPPLPPGIQNALNQYNQQSNLPSLDPFAGQSQFKPVCGR